MASVTFGNFRVDMTDPNFLAPIFGHNFDGTPVVGAPGFDQVTVRFPSGATVVFHGNFTLGMGSPVTGVDMNAPGIGLLVGISGLTGLTIGGLLGLSATQMEDALFGQANEVFTQGYDDVVIGDDSNEIAHTGAGNDIIRGNGGNDVLDGQSGADQMFGGTGNDVYYVDDPHDVVSELSGQGLDVVHAAISYTLPLNVENLILDGAPDAINGTGNALDNAIRGNDSANTLDGREGNDKLEGLGGDDTLIGGPGNDTLDGGTGADSMTGGPGDDTYVRDQAGDQVIELPGGGFDTERSSLDWVIDANVERLVLLGTASNATGDDQANVLIGNNAANVLDGGRGADSMAGGPGDDTYKVDSGADQVTEAPNQGTDIILSQVPQVLPANLENLTFGESVGNVEGIGNASANNIVGNSEANLLDGGAGNDTLKGQGGDDTLVGADGIDTLAGGVGRDVLSGGAGSDHFVFDTAIASGTNVDRIVDFATGQDKIDLSAAVFAGVGAPDAVLSGLSFVSEPGAVAHAANQHVIHDINTGMLYYDADGNGAQHMIPFAQVAAGQALAAGDFHVVA